MRTHRRLGGPPRWATSALYLGSGLALGIAWVHPALAAFAWLSIVALGVALARTRGVVRAFTGTWAAGTMARLVGLPWLTDMNRIALGHEPTAARLLALAQCLACSLGIAALVAICVGLSRLLQRRGRAMPMPVWLPVAWVLGEHVSFLVLGISNEAWLTTQWTVQPVLRGLGYLGWWATTIVCLFACAGVAQALAGRPRWALATLPALGMLAFPPLPDVGRAHLEGVAAVHVSDALTLPHRPPPGQPLSLVLWPEEARHLRPLLGEGVPTGARLRPLLPGSDAAHLVGLVTQGRLLGMRNQLVAVGPDGLVSRSRAKRQFLFMGERSFLGFGRNLFASGRLSTAMDVAGRRVTGVICGEMLSRALVAEGVADGGEVLMVAARDHFLTSDRALRHMMAVQVLRSVEYGVPSVRSSMSGWAYFVSSDGRLLARSGRERNGFLTWSPEAGGRDVDFFGEVIDGPAPARPGPDVAVLYDPDTPHLRTACPEGRCTYHPIDDFVCPGEPASAVIVAGHGDPPRWLSRRPSELAAAVRCFDPQIVVLDTCLGASSELLGAFAGLDAIVVASTTLIPASGLIYDPPFFAASDPSERAAAVRLLHGEVLRWRIQQRELSAARRQVATLDTAALDRHLVRRSPPLAAVPLGESGSVLIPVDERRLGSPIDRMRRRLRRLRR